MKPATCVQTIAFMFFIGAVTCARSAPPPEAAAERLLVDDPYVDVRSGPGAAYPIIQVAARHEWIWVEFERADWFKVRTENGQTGWVDRHQLENTLTESGGKKSFRDIVIDDYLARRLEVGVGWGHTAAAPFVRLSGTYYLRPTMAAEIDYAQIQGLYSGTNAWDAAFQMMPWNFGRFQPYLGIGVGRSSFQPNVSLISAHPVNSNTSVAQAGVRVHLGERLMLRLDWQQSLVLFSAQQSDQFHMVDAAVSFFF
jgi:hypothetical protein